MLSGGAVVSIYSDGTFAERETRTGTLRLLAPTECVMDRLAWYFHDADAQCRAPEVRVATLRAEATGGANRAETGLLDNTTI